MEYKFYAFLSRMKYIGRWGLMRSTRQENVAEHSHQTAVLAHALATIDKVIYHKDVNPETAATIALFHETAEVITGDLPTPVKYFNKSINAAYKDIEKNAEEKLLSSLPLELQKELKGYVMPLDSPERTLVRYADKLAAYIKCIEEKRSGNDEFNEAYETVREALFSYHSRCVDYFIENFIEPYYMTLDKLSKGIQ